MTVRKLSDLIQESIENTPDLNESSDNRSNFSTQKYRKKSNEITNTHQSFSSTHKPKTKASSFRHRYSKKEHAVPAQNRYQTSNHQNDNELWQQSIEQTIPIDAIHIEQEPTHKRYQRAKAVSESYPTEQANELKEHCYIADLEPEFSNNTEIQEFEESSLFDKPKPTLAYQKPQARVVTDEMLRNYAFRLLGIREYSQTELRKKMMTYGAELSKINDLLQELAEKDYQSDSRVKSVTVRQALYKGQGIYKLKQQLQKKGLTAVSTEDLEGVNWLAQAVTTRIKKFGQDIPLEQNEKARQYRFLLGRGFTHDVCQKALKISQLEDADSDF